METKMVGATVDQKVSQTAAMMELKKSVVMKAV